MAELTPAQLAKARELRDGGMSWHNISAAIQRNADLVRETLKAEGYTGSVQQPDMATAEMRDEAYRRYVFGGESIDAVGHRFDVGAHTARKWIVELGATIRSKGGAHAQEGGKLPSESWGHRTVCVIAHTKIGTYYCAAKCDWYEGKCAKVNAGEREAFKAFKKARGKGKRRAEGDLERKRRRVALEKATIRSYETRQKREGGER